jgi:uncharacterized membrane protein
MDTMLAVVFDDETKAHEGEKALLHLGADGTIGIYGYAVVTKRADGTRTIKQDDTPRPLATLAPTALAEFVSRLGEPTGLRVGGASATAATADTTHAEIGEDFVDDVRAILLPNRVAIVAEIAEEWTAPVDLRMASFGGIVFRWTLSDAKPHD